MAVSLWAVAITGAAVAVSTWNVITLTRAENAQREVELERYKTEAGLEIAKGAEESARANERAAEANARAEEATAATKAAELKLEELRRQLGPRQFDRAKFLAALVGAPKAAVELLYLRDDPECLRLAGEIAGALEAAGWVKPVPKPIPTPILDMYKNDPTSVSVGGQPWGITVVGHDTLSVEEAVERARTFMNPGPPKNSWDALARAVAESVGHSSSSSGGQYAPPAGTVRIVVAPRL